MPPQKPKVINNKQVFIIGNGESRIGFDLEQLRDYGKIYGCNLLYEEFTPDVLFVIDERIMHPCYWSGYPLDNVCWFRDWGSPIPREAYEALTDSSMITGDPNVDMSEYVYSNSRNDSTEFVLHGTNKDVAEGYEAEVRELDKNKVIDESAIELVFKPGIYTTWLNNNGDKVKDLGGGSFAPEFQKKYPALYKEFVINGPYSNAAPTSESQPTLAKTFCYWRSVNLKFNILFHYLGSLNINVEIHCTLILTIDKSNVYYFTFKRLTHQK